MAQTLQEHASFSSQLQPTAAPLLELCYDGRIFRLRQPIYLARYAEDGYIYLESKELSIVAYGTSERGAVRSFEEDFATLWDEIANAPDGSLTSDARVIKGRLQQIVKEVVDE